MLEHFILYIFSRCSYILSRGGAVETFGERQVTDLTQRVIEPMASDGLRTIGLAYKDLVPQGEKSKENEVREKREKFLFKEFG